MNRWSYYWQPEIGIKVDLGAVARPAPGSMMREDDFDGKGGGWSDQRGQSRAMLAHCMLAENY